MAKRERRKLSPLMLAAVLICSCAPGERSHQHSGTAEVNQMETGSHTQHTIDYIEFVVTDMTEAQRFYQAAFGWKFNEYGPGYAGIQGQGREVGGFRLDTQASTGGPLVVLYSKNLDKSLARVRAAGGRVIREPYGFPGGRRFHFQDPSDNELAVWSEK